jgi:hypothetical protein
VLKNSGIRVDLDNREVLLVIEKSLEEKKSLDLELLKKLDEKWQIEIVQKKAEKEKIKKTDLQQQLSSPSIAEI